MVVEGLLKRVACQPLRGFRRRRHVPLFALQRQTHLLGWQRTDWLARAAEAGLSFSHELFGPSVLVAPGFLKVGAGPRVGFKIKGGWNSILFKPFQIFWCS